MSENYINVMQSNKTKEYFDIHDRRIPDLELLSSQVLQANEYGEVQTIPIADISDYERIIQEGM